MARRRVACGLGLLLPVLALARDPIVIESRNTLPRDHVLFVGTEMSVNQHGEMVAVRRIKGRAVELANLERETVRVRGTSGLHLRPTTKVSTTQVLIEDLAVERCYSPAADPSRQQMRDQVELQEYAAAQAEIAQVEMRRDSQPVDPEGDPGDAVMSAEQQFLQTSRIMDAFQSSVQVESKTFSQVAPVQDRIGGRRKAPEFDALRLRCEVSSPRPIRDAQALVVVRLAKEGEFSDLSFTTAIGDIDAKPRDIDFIRPGIAPGWEVKETRVHVFAQAEELPSNLSEKIYAVTADEAGEYLRLVHLDRHRGGTAPAEPAWSLVPPTFFARENGQELNFPVRVDLDARGRLLRVHDENAIVPPQVREALEAMVFLPALRDGEAVAATITVNPADFYQ